MKIFNICTLTFLLLGISQIANAQYHSMHYNYEKNWFGNNEPLPAEENWIIEGVIPENIQMVEIQLFSSSNLNKKPLIVSDFRKTKESPKLKFAVPMKQKLKSNSKASIVTSFYRAANQLEIENAKGAISKTIAAYIDLNIISNKNSVKINKNPKLMIQDLNRIISRGLSLYRNKMSLEFEGLSPVIYDNLAGIAHLKLKKAVFNFTQKKDTTNSLQKLYYLDKITQLKESIKVELYQYLNKDFYILADRRSLRNYPVENKRNSISINLGYAGVYKVGNTSKFDYGQSPYAGLSIPFASSVSSSKFLSNLSFSAGILLTNIKFSNGVEMTGPIVNRPIYVGLGYKLPYYLRLNIGTTVLQEAAAGFNSIQFSPYIGIGLEVNIWLGLKK